ncbi:MAG: cell division protein ZapB [Rudaea sp.]|nr:cell division protein ZapB [Rudaea sp.]
MWTSGSSRSFKEDFTPIDVASVLAKVIELPVQTWFYKNDHQEGRHMGPVAEDFAVLFGLGSNDKYIGAVDESGVAFAAIQGLNQKVEAEREQNSKLQEKDDALARENAVLRGKLDEVLSRVSKLEAKQGR